MKAFRNVAGSIIEIDVDIDPTGQPILPPDTTIAQRPEPQPGHYVTVIDHDWVQILIPEEYISFEYRKQQALDTLSHYKNWYLEQPIEHNGIVFDADGQARNRLTQAMVVHTVNGYLPPVWIANDNSPQPLDNIEALKNIITAVQTAFTTRFFEMDTIRQQIIVATDEVTLDAIRIPTIPTFM